MKPRAGSDMQQRRERALWIAQNVNRDLKRLMLYRAYREHELERPHNLRRAKVIAYVLDHYPVVFDEDSRLVGRYATDPLSVAEKEEVAESGPLLWRFQKGLLFGPDSGGVGGHRTVDFESLLELGVRGVLRRIDEHERELTFSGETDAERAYFFRAARICLEALLRFADRYRHALLAARDASRDPEKRAAPEKAAEILSRVPAEPAGNFHEALQSVWFVQFALSLADDASCTGRADQLFARFYEQDIAAGRLTREGALALIEELYLRSNEVYGRWPETIMLGGVDRNGRPVVNDLTYLFVEAIETVGLTNPNVGLCYREDTPDDLLELCISKIAKGLSHPALYNDDVIIAGLREAGLAEEDARCYMNSTCVEITPVGCSNVQVAWTQIFPAKALEMLLNGGEQTVRHDRLEQRVGEEAVRRWRLPLAEGGTRCDLAGLETFDQFLDAYERALANVTRDCILAAVRQAYRSWRYGSCPLVSCFVRDCIERGKDVAAGGALYNDWGTLVTGFSTTVDSLLAIRDAVYRDGAISLEELAEALRADFEGSEPLRMRLRNRCAKYGRDDESADAVAVRLYDFFRAELGRYRTCLGGTFHLGIFSGWGWDEHGRHRGSHVSHGSLSGATPDGRFAGQPLSENIGPAPGSDMAGLTAVANSVTRLDHRHGLGGISVNCRFSPSMLARPEDRRKLIAFLRQFMRQGVFEVQMNVVDSKVLREAKADREKHRTLMVRVAGYSDYFCDLDEAQQDEIIARTEHSGL